MKNLILILLSLLFFSCTDNQETGDTTHKNTSKNKSPINDLKRDGVKGNIKTIFEATYHLENNYKTGEMIYYNKYGNIARGVSYNDAGDSTAAYTNIYDNDNYKISETGYNSLHKFTTSFKHDIKGNILEEETKDYGGIESDCKNIFRYDSNNNETENISVKVDSSDTYFFSQKLVYKYNDTQNKTEEYYYQRDKLSAKDTYIYDSRGNCIEEKEFCPPDSLKSVITYKYTSFDKFGNWTTKFLYPSNSYAAEDSMKIERSIQYY
jgi:hypothetical protein